MRHDTPRLRFSRQDCSIRVACNLSRGEPLMTWPTRSDWRELLPSVSTSVFAKLDVTFGEDLEGIGGKRVSW